MLKRVLDVVDDQIGFMKAGSDLPVPGAEDIIEPTNDFFQQVRPGTFDFALFKYDTHFSGEYPHSPESVPFPNIHCEFGTPGWGLAVDPSLLAGKTPVYYMSKNTFDMWGANPIGKEKTVPFKNADEQAAYANLHKVTTDPSCLKPGIPRDEFLKNVGLGTEVVLIGVASNFCDFDAMLGYLERGATVTVLEDLVRGIPHGPDAQKFLLDLTGFDRTATGEMSDVLKTAHFKKYVDSGQLRLETSASFLQRAQRPNAAPTPSGP